jgi:hypothetical protein
VRLRSVILQGERPLSIGKRSLTRPGVALPSPLFNLKRRMGIANKAVRIPIGWVLTLSAHCSRALGRTTTNQIEFFASSDGYPDHVGLRVCDYGAEPEC